MPGDLLSWALGAHGIVLPLALAGLYQFSDRRDRFAKAVGDINELLGKMRGAVTQALETHLEIVFLKAESEPIIVRPESYSERPTNPIGSDAYRDAIRRFIEGSLEAVIDYGRAIRARARWHTWATRLSWTVLTLVSWEIVCLAGLGLVERLFQVNISDDLVRWSFAPTIFLIGLFLVCHLVIFRQTDLIHASTSRYYDL